MNYPAWICSPCGRKHGKWLPTLASYHTGDCGWCGAEHVSVTEPRDFGYPDPPNKRRGRGPGKKPAMLHVTIRLPRHVLDRYPDLKTMRDDWVRYVENLPYPGKETIEAASAEDVRALLLEAGLLIFEDRQGRNENGRRWAKFCTMLDAEAWESAALMLVPEGSDWDVTSTASARIYEPYAEGVGMIPALAILAASLRARGIK